MIEFNEIQRNFFEARRGAYASVTQTEGSDSQITITNFGKQIVTEYFGSENIVRGAKSTNPQLSLKNFFLYPNKNEISLNLVFPKPTKTELRVYLSAENGFKPEGNDIWFVFEDQHNQLIIGSMPIEAWNSIETNSLSKNVSSILKEFIIVADTQIVGSGTNREASEFINRNRFHSYGFPIKISFGVGRANRIPWIALIHHTQDIKKGIYPVYLYYRQQDLLILCYGVSQKEFPNTHWPNENSLQTIENFYLSNYPTHTPEFGRSFVYKTYSAHTLPSKDVMERDLEHIAKLYTRIFEENKFEQMDLDLSLFEIALSDSNLIFSEKLITRFTASLLTKPFIILTGLSGSGKTKLASSFAKWICANEDQYKIVAVGADWTNREPLLGYPDGLNPDRYVTPENGVIELLMRANNRKTEPHFLILDEMNLSHVERYFADFLSCMESGEDIPLHTISNPEIEVTPKVKLPGNLFLIGTVNIDETTYMFSPKVLDRANVIEFRLSDEEMENFLSSSSKEIGAISNTGASMGNDFVSKAKDRSAGPEDSELGKILIKFFKELKKTGAEFGYRTASEIFRLSNKLSQLDSGLKSDEKIDIAIMQKLLPKLHGSRRKLEPVLNTLARFCIHEDTQDDIFKAIENGEFIDFQSAKIRFPVSLEKIVRMRQAVIDHGFASYAEA